MEYRAKINQIRSQYLNGKITIEDAQTQVQPLLNEMNAKAKVIAKQFGKTHKKLTFSYVFR